MKDSVPCNDSENLVRQQLMGLDGAPAFIRRARHVQDSLEGVLRRCREQREEWLDMVRMRLGTLAALAGDWTRLRRWLEDDDQVDLLCRLHDELRPRLRVPVEETRSPRALRSALHELIESLERFNRRWGEFLPKVDLTEANQAREKYNRYYLLEKECAVGRAGLTRQDFLRLSPVRLEDVARQVTPLPVPRLRTPCSR